MGCKRAIYDPGYLKSMNRPNVTLNFDGIDAVVPEGIRTKKGEIIPFDVIIWGTGFNVVSASRYLLNACALQNSRSTS